MVECVCVRVTRVYQHLVRLSALPLACRAGDLDSDLVLTLPAQRHAVGLKEISSSGLGKRLVLPFSVEIWDESSTEGFPCERADAADVTLRNITPSL